MLPRDITLTNTNTSPGISIAQGVFVKIFIIAQLVFLVSMLFDRKSKDTYLALIGTRLVLFVASIGGT